MRKHSYRAIAAMALAVGLCQPASAQLVSLPPKLVAYALTAPGFLVSFDTRAPRRSTRTVGRLFPDQDSAIVGIDFRPQDGKLYAVGNGGGIYTVDLATALLTRVGRTTTPLLGSRFGVDFDPSNGRLRLASDTGQNLLHDVGTGITQQDADFNDGFARPMVQRDLSGAAYSGNDLSAETPTSLYVADFTTDRLYRVPSPATGQLVVVGKLHPARRSASPVSAFGTIGFDIYSPADAAGKATGDLAYVSLKDESLSADAVLYRIDLGTAAVTKIGALNPNPTGEFLDFAIVPMQ